jgi:hypothetical protein
MRAEIKGATAAERPPLVLLWSAHKRQADKGYVHRKLRKEECVVQWANIVLPDPAPINFPPPLLPVNPFANRALFDFTECDMGGGKRTPLIKAGPQYYLRTLPSKPYYILQRCPRRRCLLVERDNR